MAGSNSQPTAAEGAQCLSEQNPGRSREPKKPSFDSSNRLAKERLQHAKDKIGRARTPAEPESVPARSCGREQMRDVATPAVGNIQAKNNNGCSVKTIRQRFVKRRMEARSLQYRSVRIDKYSSKILSQRSTYFGRLCPAWPLCLQYGGIAMTPTCDLLTAEEVRRRLGVEAVTLDKWRSTRKNTLAFMKIGGLVSYSPQAVKDFVDRADHPGARRNGQEENQSPEGQPRNKKGRPASAQKGKSIVVSARLPKQRCQSRRKSRAEANRTKRPVRRMP